ncbi:GDSL-type esterase/lipase family protein [Sphingomonas corticis]|jgi:lysophospholipase L1-like esterase|uniref:Chitooligosaccharide deacetylase n=1 Tax=Sphingomonas corticis TaxID=2722791 RepID=A0ABX1CPD4_9SPHN|nr:GDSL-type esterase/lipase family protein [Sphingomonas corticis]NJR78145.1 polysaccharide deacetylase family protein [Sphingomonas corticis]
MRLGQAIGIAAALALPAHAAERSPRWIATWGTSQLSLEDKDALPALGGDRGVTVRQTVRVAAGGERVRVRFSNAFGRAPLTLAKARAADVPLTFAGRPSTDIPPGAEVYSDEAAVSIPRGGDLTISLHLPRPGDLRTGHPGARATTIVAPGDQVDAATPTGGTSVPRWFAIADVEVSAPASARTSAAGTIVAIGDSITDGYGVAPDTNTRWTDVLAARLRGSTALAGWGVVNAGIGGNRVTLDGLGPNLLARFDRDVVARSGTKVAIVLEGINDLGTLTREKPATPAEHAALVRRITAGYVEIARRARAHGIRIIGGTVMPFVGNDYYHADAANEADRQAVNAFIRQSGTFDAVIDFDAALRDPARPDRLAPAYDSGDHLHPSAAGFAAMARAVPLALIAGPLPARAEPGPSIALTFDDIPVHGALPPGATRAGVMRDLVAALKAAGAPAHGFINGARQVGDADAAAATAAWRAAFPIGNHGYEHRGVDELNGGGFRDQLVRNEAAVGSSARWFRYPYLSEGATAARRDAARAVLAERGYRIAAVTASFADYSYNDPYARCMAKRDAAGVAALERHWLAAVRLDAESARARMRALYGREVPLVLLMHVGAFDARMLPRTLALYRAMGFRFVALDAAQADPVYAAANDPAMPGPSPDLARSAAEAGVVPPAAALPSIDFGKLCQ